MCEIKWNGCDLVTETARTGFGRNLLAKLRTYRGGRTHKCKRPRDEALERRQTSRMIFSSPLIRLGVVHAVWQWFWARQCFVFTRLLRSPTSANHSDTLSTEVHFVSSTHRPYLRHSISNAPSQDCATQSGMIHNTDLNLSLALNALPPQSRIMLLNIAPFARPCRAQIINLSDDGRVHLSLADRTSDSFDAGVDLADHQFEMLLRGFDTIR
jgi:hypothetical protein